MSIVNNMPKKIRIPSVENRKEVIDFYHKVNDEIKNGRMNADIAMKVADFCLLLTCGVPKEEINPGIYRKLRGYLISNMGPLKVSFGNRGVIERVEVGTIDIVNLYNEDIDFDTISPEIIRNKPIYGMIPTSDDTNRLNITLDGKKFVGMQVSTDEKMQEIQRSNMRIGEYYFSRKKILSKNKTAELVKLDLDGPATDGLIQTIEVYDKKGNMTPIVQMNEFIEMNGIYQLFCQHDLVDQDIDRSKEKIRKEAV